MIDLNKLFDALSSVHKFRIGEKVHLIGSVEFKTEAWYVIGFVAVMDTPFSVSTRVLVTSAKSRHDALSDHPFEKLVYPYQLVTRDGRKMKPDDSDGEA